MSRVKFRAATGQVSTTTGLRTILQLVAAANHRLSNVFFSISFEGISSTDPPIEVRVLRQTTAGTMSALTPIKDESTDDETLQVTAQHTATVEPTAGDVLYRQFVHPQNGARELGPFTVPGGTRLGLDVLGTPAVDCIVSARGEE
jgi:hypothetical protein